MIHRGTSYGSMSSSITSYKAGILYADPKSPHQILLWQKNSTEVEVFAGSGSEGNKDGMASRTEFYQPIGLSVEFDHIVDVCDAQTNCIKILTSQFLNAVGKIYKAFSVHEKHQPYSVSSIQEAVELVSGTLRVLCILEIQSLSILCPNVPSLCRPCLLYNPCQLYQ